VRKDRWFQPIEIVQGQETLRHASDIWSPNYKSNQAERHYSGLILNRMIPFAPSKTTMHFARQFMFAGLPQCGPKEKFIVDEAS
jgi:hypothetical protein